MSSIIFQDVNNIEYTSIKFDYLAINTDDILDQKQGERLLVNQSGSRFSMILLDNGLFLNSTREEAQQHIANNYSLYAQNAYFEGTLTAKTINILDEDISDSNIANLLNAINSNIGPFEPYVDPLYQTYRNYYTHNNINILANSDTQHARCNLHPLQINRSAEYSSYNTQLSIGNNRDDNENNQSKLLIGILGDDYTSPATIITNPGKSLEFYISKQNCNIDKLYEDHINLPNYSTIPTLKIDTDSCVNINSSNGKTLTYEDNDETTKLNVEGYGYIKELFVYDHNLDKPSHLDDIYFKKATQNFATSNIIPGIFDGYFGFNSNLKVNCNIDVSNITTLDLSSDSANIDNIKTNTINATNIKVSDHFYKDNDQLNIQNITVKQISYKEDTIKNNLLSSYFYNNDDIYSNINYNLCNIGLINNIIGINDNIKDQLINDTCNALYNIDIEYYTISNINKGLYNEFKVYGSNIDLNCNIITEYNINIFSDLSNHFILTAISSNTEEITSNIYDLLYNEGYYSLSNILQYYISNHNDLEIDYNVLSNILNDYSFIDENCNITSNILSNINISGFSNLYIEDYYTDYYLESIYPNISNNEFEINSNYRLHISNIVNSSKYTKEEIINGIYENGIKEYQYTYDIESNFNFKLDITILNSNDILSNYSNTLISEGSLSIIENYIINFDNFKIKLNSNLNNIITNIPKSNLLSFETCATTISEHINSENGHYKLTSNLDVILNRFDYKGKNKETIINRQLLNFITNYDTSNIETDKQILTYHINDAITVAQNNTDISVPYGKLAIGTNDTNGSMLSIENNNSNAEIYIKNIIEEGEYDVTIGHNQSSKETFTIKTNNIKEHNIELNAGVNGPNLFLKANTNKVGINTRNPTKSLDVNGDIIVNKYYVKELNKPQLIANFLEYEDDIRLLKTKKPLLIDTKVEMKKDLHINKIFKSGNELFNFDKKIKNNNEYLESDVGCIFIGERLGNKSINNTAMLLQNSLNIKENNTVLRLLKSNRWSGGESGDRYTGIEFTEYETPHYTGWYIHNKHNNNDFEIGYRNNYEVSYPILKTNYTSEGINSVEIGNSESKDNIILKNNVKIEGDIDVTGTYKLNGIEFSSNNITLSTLIDPLLDIDNTIVQPGDIDLRTSSRIVNRVADKSSMFIGTYYNTSEKSSFFDEYLLAHHNKLFTENTSNFDAKLNIITRVNTGDIQPPLLAVKATYNLNSKDLANKFVKSSIRIATLNNTDTDYWENKNYTDLIYKYYDDKCVFSIDLKHKNNKITPFKIIREKDTRVYSKLSSNDNQDRSDTFFHIIDNTNDTLLVLEKTDNTDVKIKLENERSKWNIIGNEIFKIQKKDKNILLLNDSGIGINNEDSENISASLDINNINNVGIVINNNNKDSIDTKNIEIEANRICNLEISSNISEIEYNLNNLNDDRYTSNIEYESNITIIKTLYNCNFEGNSITDYSKFYDVYINNYESESNFILKINVNNIELNTLLESANSQLSNIRLNTFSYEGSNDTNTDVKVEINTIYSNINNLLISNIDNSNYAIYLNGNDDSATLLSNYEISNINFNIYHPNNCNYNFTTDIKLELDYTIKTSIISGIASYLNITEDNTNDYTINFIKDEYRLLELSSNIIDNLSNIIIIEGEEETYNLDNITLKYHNINNECNVSIDIIDEQNHIKLKNNEDLYSYYVTSKESNFNILYQNDDNSKLDEILNLTNTGKLKINELIVNTIRVSGSIYDTEAEIFCNEEFNTINIKNNNLYINTDSDYSILINTNEFFDINSNANVIFGNKDNIENVDIITLQSSKESGYIKLTTKQDDYNYKIGKTNSNFDILYKDQQILCINPNNNTVTYSIFDVDDLSDADNDGIILSGEIDNSIVKNITTNYDYIFNSGRLKDIKNIDYNSNLIFTEHENIIMSMNQDDVTMHQRLICSAGMTSGSDRRIKENINKIENALDKIDKLDGVSYYNKLSKSNEIGLIAQDVKKVIPEVVVDGDLMGIQYGNMISLLIEGIKELRKEIKNG
tara:strand:+ start:1311 stop:7376 length:6066 start_codon:yes stop_codon:yes gene_type:complete